MRILWPDAAAQRGSGESGAVVSVVEELWFLLERPSLFSTSPLRSNVDVQFKSIQQFPVDVSLKQFRKQCKRKERQSKSRDSERINQKEETRKRERNYPETKFIFARRKKKKKKACWDMKQRKRSGTNLWCISGISWEWKSYCLFGRWLYKALLIPIPAGKHLKGKAVWSTEWIGNIWRLLGSHFHLSSKRTSYCSITTRMHPKDQWSRPC